MSKDSHANTKISVKVLGGTADGDDLTGSCILLTIRRGKNITRLLIDSGLIQCQNRDFIKKNLLILGNVKPSQIDGIIITHSHVDHVGRLPLIVNNGFGGDSRIMCTRPTAKIIGVMLEDSAKIQSELCLSNNQVIKSKTLIADRRKARAKQYQGKRECKTKTNLKNIFKEVPLYTMEDVDKTCDLIKNGGYDYQEWNKLFNHGVSLKFYQSGHVLGGAICVIRVETKEGPVHLGFSGDLGRSDGIILPPPAKIDEPIDYWFTESTYGGKIHPLRDEEMEVLKNLVREAYRRKKIMILPSFALERVQEVIYLLTYFMWTGEIPTIPIYLDAPMGARITYIYSDNWNEGMFADQDRLPFNPFCRDQNKFFRVVESYLDSAALVKTPGPYIVIAGSGVCEAGRVREHLRAHLGDPSTIVCLVGYMPKNTLGRKLKEGTPMVRMNRQEIFVEAKIVAFESLSAHADGRDLVNYAKAVIKKRGHHGHQKIFIVHGEDESSGFLKKALIKARVLSKKNIIIPTLNEEMDL